MSNINTSNNAWAATNSAVSAALNTIGTSANIITRTVGTADAGLDMLSKYMTKAKNEQALRHAIAKHDYKHRIGIESALSRADLEVQVANKLKSNPDFAQSFSEAHTEIKTLLDAVEG